MLVFTEYYQWVKMYLFLVTIHSFLYAHVFFIVMLEQSTILNKVLQYIQVSIINQLIVIQGQTFKISLLHKYSSIQPSQ